MPLTAAIGTKAATTVKVAKIVGLKKKEKAEYCTHFFIRPSLNYSVLKLMEWVS
jgi:hypothetical protein